MLYPWHTDLWRMLHARSVTAIGAVLLGGPRGVGKRTFARALAQGVLCASPRAGGEPCGACMSCRLFAEGSHPDFYLVEPAADEARPEASDASTGTNPPREGVSILVGQVRELTDSLVVPSQLGGAKVVLMQPAERLHPSAASALLKTLEEPPPRTLFILVADRPQRLPATIRSRCFRLEFSLPARETALSWLAAKGIGDAEIALAQAGFAPLTAVELDRSGFFSRRQTLSGLLASVDVDSTSLASAVDPTELALMCRLLQRWCYDLLSLRLANKVRYNPDYAEKLRRIADNADVHQLQSLIQELATAAGALEHPLNSRLVIEQLAIGYTRMLSRQHP